MHCCATMMLGRGRGHGRSGWGGAGGKACLAVMALSSCFSDPAALPLSRPAELVRDVIEEELQVIRAELGGSKK